MIEEGIYEGAILKGWLEQMDDGGLIMCFDVQLPHPHDIVVTARHFTTGDYGRIGEKVAELLNLSWPEGLREIDKTVGLAVPIKIKHKESKGEVYVNAYINVGRVSEPATKDQVEAGIAKLGAKKQEGDGLPF